MLDYSVLIKNKIMNDILFYLLILALLYYFFYYLPQKQIEPTKPLTHSQFTQTNPNPIIKDDSELESTLDNLISEIKQLNQQLK